MRLSRSPRPYALHERSVVLPRFRALRDNPEPQRRPARLHRGIRHGYGKIRRSPLSDWLKIRPRATERLAFLLRSSNFSAEAAEVLRGMSVAADTFGVPVGRGHTSRLGETSVWQPPILG